MHPGLCSAEHDPLVRGLGAMVLHCVIFKFSWLPLTLHTGYQKKINRHLTELNETKQTQEDDLPRWHFPSGYFTNNGTLPCHYFMDKPDTLRVKDFASEDLPSIWSQDKQHVAQYLGKFCFVYMKRISYSDDSLNITVVESRNSKEVSLSNCQLSTKELYGICFGSETWKTRQRR